MWCQVPCDMLCCAAYMHSSAGYKMSRQPALGKFGFTKSIDHRGLQRDIKLPDFAAKMQKAIMYSEYIKVFISQQGLSVHVKCFNVLTKKVLIKECITEQNKRHLL